MKAALVWAMVLALGACEQTQPALSSGRHSLPITHANSPPYFGGPLQEAFARCFIHIVTYLETAEHMPVQSASDERIRNTMRRFHQEATLALARLAQEQKIDGLQAAESALQFDLFLLERQVWDLKVRQDLRKPYVDGCNRVELFSHVHLR